MRKSKRNPKELVTLFNSIATRCSLVPERLAGEFKTWGEAADYSKACAIGCSALSYTLAADVVVMVHRQTGEIHQAFTTVPSDWSADIPDMQELIADIEEGWETLHKHYGVPHDESSMSIFNKMSATKGYLELLMGLQVLDIAGFDFNASLKMFDGAAEVPPLGADHSRGYV